MLLTALAMQGKRDAILHIVLCFCVVTRSSRNLLEAACFCGLFNFHALKGHLHPKRFKKQAPSEGSEGACSMSQTAIRQGFLQRKMLQFRVKIQLEIFVEIFSVMGADLTKNTTWISNCHHVRGDILGDHGACADHAVVADGDVGHDLHAGADPNISPHADGRLYTYRSSRRRGLTGCPAVANTMPGPIMQSSPI